MVEKEKERKIIVLTNNKYGFTGETLNCEGHVLNRIIALRDIKDEQGNVLVRKGEKGGFIEKEKNLDGNSNAWVSKNGGVFENAQVFGEAQVYEEARVSGNALIFGKAQVFGNAQVSEEAQVSGNAQVSEEALVSGNDRVSRKRLRYLERIEVDK